MGSDVLIVMNTGVLSEWLGSNMSAGQSGGVLLLGQLGSFHFSLILNVFIYSFFYFLMYLNFHCQIYLLIYSLSCLLLNFWYFFIHKFSWFPQSKILCVFECSFCSFTVCVCLCAWDLFACLFAYSTKLCLCVLSFFSGTCICCIYVGLYMCASVCFCIYNTV